jgi:hypothetical protein
MKQQTAVEYLIEQLFPKALSEEQYYHIEKAKEMEKEQIETAYLKGQDNIDNEGWYINEKGQELYYNTTFKNK